MRFSGWSGPILTDSGRLPDFQPGAASEISEQGATFRSHVDGRLLELTPERAVQIQEESRQRRGDGADHVIGLPRRSRPLWTV